MGRSTATTMRHIGVGNQWQLFPNIFGNETDVLESHISEAPEGALREFLTFVRGKIGVLQGSS